MKLVKSSEREIEDKWGSLEADGLHDKCDARHSISISQTSTLAWVRFPITTRLSTTYQLRNVEERESSWEENGLYIPANASP